MYPMLHPPWLQSGQKGASKVRPVQWPPSLEGAMEQPKAQGKAYKDMSSQQKVLFVLKLAVCIVTFGMVFPNIMAE
jgi:hypothetical protein